MSQSKPRLDGARNVYFRLTSPQHADLARNIEKVERGWAAARRVLASAGGLCHCGNRWGHLMNGVDVTLLDKAPYTARCWDDDRVWVNLPLFHDEPNDGVDALVHEFGHRVWFQCLTEEQQDRWAASWRQTKKRPTPRWAGQCSGTISGYACTSDLEDFAEVFLAVVRGRVDEHNRKRWQEVCGCGKGACEARTPPPPAGKGASLVRRYGSAEPRAAIRWSKYAGGAAKISQTPGGGPYAKSADGRFIIWVLRYRGGDHGDRHYTHHFCAVDYGIPSAGQKFTAVPIQMPGAFPRESSSNVKAVMAAVDRWAAGHPSR